ATEDGTACDLDSFAIQTLSLPAHLFLLAEVKDPFDLGEPIRFGLACDDGEGNYLISAGEYAAEFHFNLDFNVAIGCGLLLGGLLFSRLLLGRLLLGGLLLSRPLFGSRLFSRLLLGSVPVLGSVSCRSHALRISLGV